ncbi:MAG: flagellin lysine-N-methylase [Clostridia bacterium]|nr:flagellin lysine-N-methylase [Clostridia bacterium]
MDIRVPSYYPEFECIADGCRHSCCIGWEIDIDEDTAEYYSEIDGDMGARLRESIGCEDGCHYFKTGEGDRCPFLNERGLCDIITELGEESLCQICADHPRFRNSLSDLTEVGLGMCCEEAARLMLTYEEPFSLLSCDGGECALTPFEEELLCERQRILDILTDRSMPVEERIGRLSVTEADAGDLIPFYRSLERLDGVWDGYLDRYDPKKENITENSREQLLCYFVYRYLAQSREREDIAAYLRFALLSYRIIIGVCEDSTEGLVEAARAYSSEIEYSTENVEEILNKLTLIE